MDDDGQFAIGDGTNFLKFFQDTDGSYKLVISASQITLGTKNLVSSDDVQEIVDNLEIGGTNLLRNSNFKYDFTYWVESYPGGCAQILESQCDYIGKFVQLTQEQVYPNASDVCRFYANPITNFTHTVGETYTLSFYGAIINSDIDSVGIIAAIAGDGQRIGRFKVSEANTWTLFTATYTATIAGSLTFHSDVEGAIFQLANIKLEKGNKATDWSPSPKDIESDLENNYYTKTEVDSKIEITEEGITSSVKEEVSKIEIGGRNYAELTNRGSTNWGWSSNGGATTATSIDVNGVRGVELKCTEQFNQGSWSVIYYSYKGACPGKYEAGETYTISFDIYPSVSSGNTWINVDFKELDSSDRISETGSFKLPEANKWTRVSLQLKFLDPLPEINTVQSLYMAPFPSGVGVYYRFKNLKIEKGTKATDWTPAPEDTDSKINDIEIGTRNLVLDSYIDATSAVYGFALRKLSQDLVAGETYTLSFNGRVVDGDGSLVVYIYTENWSDSFNIATKSKTDQTVSGSFTAGYSEPYQISVYSYLSQSTAGGNVHINWVKLEKGNKPTDWSPAPEDMATGEEVENAQAAADEANATADSTESRVTVAETTIQQLSDSISMLVTDENGNSMMTQTGDGWTFNMGAINSSLNDAKETLSNLSGSVAGIDRTVDKLDSLVDDLAKKTAYIVMTTDDTGAPCIELGKSDNPFKVRITNTSVDFLEGSIRIAYISNKALYIERAIVKDELQIGEGKGFVWKRRSNGNMGLRWVGG